MEVIKKLNETTLFGLFPKLHYMDKYIKVKLCSIKSRHREAYNEVINIIYSIKQRKKDEKYQTKFPEQVEAVQLTTSNYKEVIDWTEKECIVHYQDAGNMAFNGHYCNRWKYSLARYFYGMYISNHKGGEVCNYTEEGFKKTWEEII